MTDLERRTLIAKRLREMAVETGGLNCLECGYEHSCGIHGCAVLKAAAEMIEHTPPIGRCGTCKWAGENIEHPSDPHIFCDQFERILLRDDFCSLYEPKEADEK